MNCSVKDILPDHMKAPIFSHHPSKMLCAIDCAFQGYKLTCSEVSESVVTTLFKYFTTFPSVSLGPKISQGNEISILIGTLRRLSEQNINVKSVLSKIRTAAVN